MGEPDRTARKRRRRRKEARPAELIEAGLAEFAEKGFAATRMEDIAARADVVKGTIYLYFENKEALFREAIRSRIEPAIADMQSIVDRWPGDTESLLRLVFRTMYDKLVRGDVREIIRILISEGPRFPEIVEYYHAHTVKIGMTILATILKRGVERGEFRAGLPVDQPIVVIAPVIAAAIWRLTFDPHDPLDIEAYAAAHADIILNGVLERR
ncbi:MAG: TetR/AcrR family transcriptional regulator [Oricola sp.]